VLVALLKSHPDLEVTALVRNPAHLDAVRGLGVVVVEGKFSDVDLVTKHARAADITINTASSDDVVLTNAILAGHKARVAEDKKAPAIFLHTSGVAVFMDDGQEGKHDPNSKVWDVRSHCRPFLGLVLIYAGQDGDEADIRAITPQKVHGPVDVPYVFLVNLRGRVLKRAYRCCLGFCAPRKRATRSHTSFAPPQSSAPRQDPSRARRSFSISCRSSRSGSKRPSTSGRAPTYSIQCVVFPGFQPSHRCVQF
jgi:hypothetical protein